MLDFQLHYPKAVHLRWNLDHALGGGVIKEINFEERGSPKTQSSLNDPLVITVTRELGPGEIDKIKETVTSFASSYNRTIPTYEVRPSRSIEQVRQVAKLDKA